MLYTFLVKDNQGTRHELQAFGIDQISDDTTAVDLNGVMSVFPDAPKKVFARPKEPIDILIGSMYMNIQPFGGEDEFTRGRLRLVRSIFGCGYILSGTHPSISVKENTLTLNAKTLVNCARLTKEEETSRIAMPYMSCNRSIAKFEVARVY